MKAKVRSQKSKIKNQKAKFNAAAQRIYGYGLWAMKIPILKICG
ncbi:hypothetical protein ACP8Y2_05595 [Herpetosiphon llansteffanensis]